MTYILGFFLLITFVLLTLVTFVSYRLAKKMMAIEDQTEASLDILDDVYSRLSYSASIPIMHDEPVVKQVVADIKSARDAVMLIASKIANDFDQADEGILT